MKMSAAAKGFFPGRLRKKLLKKTVKYKKELQKYDLEEQLFGEKTEKTADDIQLMFVEDSDQDVEFVGFSSEECGLQAYKRVSKSQGSPSITSNDILRSSQAAHTSKDKVVTRRSFALDSLSNFNHAQSTNSTPVKNVSDDSKICDVTALKNCRGFSDNAFMKYQNSKLDFRRLSKKAKSKRGSYKALNAEERKDTSTASLKYAAEIYQKAKNSGSPLIQARSPIKPATFILPPNPPPLGQSSNQNDDVTESDFKKVFGNKRKGTNAPQSLSKSSSNRPCSSPKIAPENLSPATCSSIKTQKGFTLPLKSTRSSRIIKLNRKYSDSTFTQNVTNRSSSANIEDSNSIDDFPQQTVVNKLNNNQTKRRGRKPLIKEATFRVPDENSLAASSGNQSNSETASRTPTSSRIRRLIKKARFKHPTSSDALVMGSECKLDDPSPVVCKNPIRKATFTAPTLKNIAKKTLHRNAKVELSDFGLPPVTWSKLLRAHKKKWILGTEVREIPPWTKQEIHNILHGANTFGPGWSSIARQYDFHELHRDWLSVCQKGKKCCQIGLLSSTYKVNSAILLQLKPKYSKNPNMTIFSPSELSVRGLSRNVPCNPNVSKIRKDLPIPPRARLKINKNVTVDLSINNRIFGTQLSEEFKFRKVNLREIPKNDFYLGLSAASWFRMLKPRTRTKFKKTAWTPWEIHNILHGVHYFGVGAWSRIWSMYRFMDGRDNLSIRARFKSVCCRGLIVAGDVRPDIFPRLHVVLSKEGKKYFKRNKISVTLCSLSEKQQDTAGVNNKLYVLVSPNKDKTGFIKPRRDFDLKENDKEATTTDEDGVSISPSRRAVHLFGTPPLWDGLTQADLLKTGDNEMPVINVLESSLRRNVKSQRRSSADDVIASPTSNNSPAPTQRNSSPVKRTRSKSESKGSAPPTKNKSRGPRIKHVCRRASLVTGQTIATMEDRHPHLTALPLKEREKILAHPEKFKDIDSSSENEVPHKAIGIVAKKRNRKRTITRRCGKCSTCVESPCAQCDLCRKPTNSPGNQDKVPPCKSRKPCLNLNENEPIKRSRRSAAPPVAASRKSSRLQQQLVPLVAPSVTDQQTVSLSTVEAPPYHSITTITDDAVSSPDSFSPSDRNFFERLNQQRQSLIRIDRWKETYDLDLLWKSGGHPIIASSPAPPPISCLLCGSSGHPEEPVDRLIYCSSCCEPFHSFCADPNPNHPVIRKKIENGSWLCSRCKHCLVCGSTGKLLECRRCMRTYHSECLGPTYPTKDSSKKLWVCMQCISCGSCGTMKPGHLPTSKWTHDYSMCQKCGDLYDKGNYCPICQKCYSDEDYDCRMIQCAKCKRWIHSLCENLTVEMYTILSHMPDSVQYKCPMCDGRANKLKETSNLADPSSSAPVFQLEKLRNLLFTLPAPLWKKLIEQEIQSGLEAIIMSLFHNKAAFVVLKKNEPISDDDSKPQSAVTKPRDLFAIRFAVHNQRYQSIGQFYSDVMHVVESVTESSEKEALESVFKEEASRVFSWFNFQTGKIKDEQDLSEDFVPHTFIAAPCDEHDYAQFVDNKQFTSSNDKTSVCVVDKAMDRYDDMRQCIFCNYYGDDEALNCGRLLYCGQDDWCHVNCALWSAEVYEQHDGSLENVHSAASRGKMMKCDYCKLPGATVGCNTRGCPKNYHFSCAKLSHCSFQPDRKVFCRRHANASKRDVPDDELFKVDRLVCVDNDEMRPNRRWQRGIPSSNLTVLIGSLTVQQIGHLNLSSDSKDFLHPISYRITRLFWSALNANKKTVYTISVSENKSSALPEQIPAAKESVDNLTISHSVAESLNSHGDPPASSSPILSSPPRIQRTDLGETADLDLQIGPLSPTRRMNMAPLPHQDRLLSKRGSQYTIIANINKTLPQAVTPHPGARFTLSSASCETTSTTTSKYESPIKISPRNPYLNIQIPTTSSNPQDKTSLSIATSTISNNNVLVESASSTLKNQISAPDSNLSPKNIISSLVSTSTVLRDQKFNPETSLSLSEDLTLSPSYVDTNLTQISPLKVASTPRKKGLKIKRKNTPQRSTSEQAEHSIDRVDFTSVQKNISVTLDDTSGKVKTGTSGSLIQSAAEGSASTSLLTSDKPSGFPSTDAVTKESDLVVQPPSCSSRSSAYDQVQCSEGAMKACSVVLNRSNSAEMLDAAPSNVISLIRQARSAAQTEKHSSATVSSPDVSFSSRGKEKTSIAPNVACSKKSSSTREVAYEQPPSEASYWKKRDKTLATSSSVATRESRRCKDVNINYSENKQDELFEEAISRSLEINDDRDSKSLEKSDTENEKSDTESKIIVAPEISDSENFFDEKSASSVNSDNEVSAGNESLDKNSSPTDSLKISSSTLDNFKCNSNEIVSSDVPKHSVDDVIDDPVETESESKTEEKHRKVDLNSTNDANNRKIAIENYSVLDVDNMASACDSSLRDCAPSSATASDDEPTASTFPSKQLRKFARGFATPARLTRSRSKSFELQMQSNSSEDCNVESVTSHNEKSPDASDTSSDVQSKGTRRYPRRNTYTCLKSFSGLSTNYALASYSRDQELPSTTSKKRKASRIDNANNQKTPKSSPPLTKTLDSSPDALRNLPPREDSTCEETKSIEDEGFIAFSAQKHDVIDATHSRASLESSPRPDIQDSTSQCSIVSSHSSQTLAKEQCNVDNKLDEEVLSALVNSGDTVRELLEDVLNSLDNKEPTTVDKVTDSNTSKDFSCDDSIEVPRGGGKDESPALPLLDESSFILPQEQSCSESLSESVENVLTSENSRLSSDVKDSLLTDSRSVSMFENEVCPVLSADDVETVLEGSTVQQTPGHLTTPTTLVASSVHDSSRGAATLPHRKHPRMPPLSPIAPPSRLSLIHPPSVTRGNPLIMSRARSPMSVHRFPNGGFEKPVLKNTSNLMSRHQSVARPPALARHTVLTQKVNLSGPPVRPVFITGSQTHLVAPVQCIPMCIEPNPLQVRPQPVLRGTYRVPPPAVHQPDVLAVPYSVRVTMTMTPAVQTETFVDPNYPANPQNVFCHPSSQIPSRGNRQTTSTPMTNQKQPTATDPFPNTVHPPTRPPRTQTSVPTNLPSKDVSIESVNLPTFALPLDSSSKSSAESPLERLIDFYSAKNNLSPQEKAIVRTIISRQINNANQSSKVTREEGAKSSESPEVTRKACDETRQSSLRSKRGGSRDQSKSGHTPKAKRKRKEKFSLKVDLDETSSSCPEQTQQFSHLYDVYKNRHSHKQTDKPINKFLSSFNIFLDDAAAPNKPNKLQSSPDSEPTQHLIFEISSDDGYHAKGSDLQELIDDLLSAIQECRFNQRAAFLPSSLRAVMTPYAFLGLSHDAVRFLVEQLPGATHCPCYKAKYHKKTKEEISHINPHGCCRAEQYKGRSKPDMFSFLASKHRPLPEYQPDKSQSDEEMMQLSNRRPTSMGLLPMAMRFRHLRTFSKQAVGVYRSSIHGRGLFCKRDIEASEMIMEYTGQMIRRELTDKREQYYESKSIGCYMFRMDDHFVVDATVMGSAARFINHSCEPNCYSKIVNIEGKKHIVIFALRKIYRGEELTYDYKFPIEDASHKITCNCGSRLCRKYMN